MGQTGADFGAVSTLGLMQRVRRKATNTKEKLDKVKFMTAAGRARRKTLLDVFLDQMEIEYKRVVAGETSEESFREKLISVLDPRMSGGDQEMRIRW